MFISLYNMHNDTVFFIVLVASITLGFLLLIVSLAFVTVLSYRVKDYLRIKMLYLIHTMTIRYRGERNVSEDLTKRS